MKSLNLRRAARRLRLLPLVSAIAAITALVPYLREAFVPSPRAPREGRSILQFGALYWSQAASVGAEEGLPKKRMFATEEEAKAAAAQLKAAGVQAANLLEEPVDMLPPVLPNEAKSSEMVRDLVREAIGAISQGDLGSAANIAADIIAEGQAAIEEDGIPWEQVGPFFIAAVLLANSAQFIYPLMEEAMEEDDYDRLPMPSGRPGARRQRVEEVDLKLPPKPQSQIVAEAAAKKKVEKKKDVDMDFEESQRSA